MYNISAEQNSDITHDEISKNSLSVVFIIHSKYYQALQLYTDEAFCHY